MENLQQSLESLAAESQEAKSKLDEIADSKNRL
jgi:hypothetical protein